MRPEHALARGLVERLARLLPAPLMLQAKGSVVRASCPDGLWTEMDLGLLVNQSGPLVTRLERASERILDMVQDFVTLNNQSPWPVPEGAGSTGGSYLALPGVSIKGPTLHLWDGGQSDPVIELAPLRSRLRTTESELIGEGFAPSGPPRTPVMEWVLVAMARAGSVGLTYFRLFKVKQSSQGARDSWLIANAGVVAVLAYLVARVASASGVVLFLVISASVVGVAEERDRRRRR